MATIRQKRPGVWEVRVFTGRNADGRPTQVSKTVQKGLREKFPGMKIYVK